MPLDINALRAIANQNPDKLVYVHGQSLKTTRNVAHHGAHTYQAATNAFLKACTDHYGSRMGEAIVKFLLADIEGGGFATVKIVLPKAWDSLMKERGYAPLATFRLKTDMTPDTPPVARRHRPPQGGTGPFGDRRGKSRLPR